MAASFVLSHRKSRSYESLERLIVVSRSVTDTVAKFLEVQIKQKFVTIRTMDVNFDIKLSIFGQLLC
jgi:hypothetical protein